MAYFLQQLNWANRWTNSKEFRFCINSVSVSNQPIDTGGNISSYFGGVLAFLWWYVILVTVGSTDTVYEAFHGRSWCRLFFDQAVACFVGENVAVAFTRHCVTKLYSFSCYSSSCRLSVVCRRIVALFWGHVTSSIFQTIFLEQDEFWKQTSSSLAFN